MIVTVLFFLLHFYSLTEWIVVYLWYRKSWWFSSCKAPLCVQWWQGMVSSLWPSAGGPDVTSATLLPGSLTGFSWEKARKSCLLPHDVCVSCSQFLLQKKRLHANFLEWKDQNTSWLFFIIMLLQCGLQPTIDCLGSVDKQKVLVDIFLDVPPFFILSSLSSSYTF